MGSRRAPVTLAIILNQKFGKAVKTTISSLRQGRTGIVFFDTIPGFDGTGHISLWDGGKVVDAGDYGSVSPRTLLLGDLSAHRASGFTGRAYSS